MRRGLLILLALLLSGCFTSGKRGSEKGLALYDLGLVGAPLVAARHLPLGIEVRAPLWIDSLGINYRLAYAEPARLREYAQSRWAGPPAQLVQQRLIRQLALTPAGQGRAKCVLRIEIGEFGQHFATPGSSTGILQGRAYWLGSNRQPLAERDLLIERAAPSPDARGGVAALQAAVEQLAADLLAWEKQEAASGRIALCTA